MYFFYNFLDDMNIIHVNTEVKNILVKYKILEKDNFIKFYKSKIIISKKVWAEKDKYRNQM